MAPIAILSTITELLTGANIALPLIFVAIKAIRDKIDPTVTDAQLINLLDATWQRNHTNAQQQIAELRAGV